MLRHIKPGMLVFSVLYILLGLLLLLAPQAVADVFCIALGLLVVLCGLQSLYGYFKKDNGSIRAAVSLLLSLPTIALGMWALLCTVQSAMTFEWLLPLLFGLMLLVDGVVRAQSSFALAKRKGQKWWVVLLLSIVSLLCGALLACSQLLNNRNVDLLLLSGIFLLAEGILNLCCTIYIAMEFHALAASLLGSVAFWSFAVQGVSAQNFAMIRAGATRGRRWFLTILMVLFVPILPMFAGCVDQIRDPRGLRDDRHRKDDDFPDF